MGGFEVLEHLYIDVDVGAQVLDLGALLGVEDALQNERVDIIALADPFE